MLAYSREWLESLDWKAVLEREECMNTVNLMPLVASDPMQMQCNDPVLACKYRNEDKYDRFANNMC